MSKKLTVFPKPSFFLTVGTVITALTGDFSMVELPEVSGSVLEVEASNAMFLEIY